MVKVFPSSLGFIEQQRLLTEVQGEPVAITCSEECVFIAEEGCLLEIFSLATLQLLGQVRTVSSVKDLVYNAKGDCIVTLERKNHASHGFARVYFKWRGASVDKPMRISLLNSFSEDMRRGVDHSTAEIIELPGEFNSPVTCLACCTESGRIAVGMETTLRIFTLESHQKGSMSSGEESDASHSSEGLLSHSIDILLDIHTNTSLCSLSIFSDYVAFISTHEVRVLKLSVLRDPLLHPHQFPFTTTPDDYLTSSSCSPAPSPALNHSAPTTPHKHGHQVEEAILEDKDFVKWSPSRVWEEEKAANSSPVSTSSSLVDVSLPSLRSHDSRGPSPTIGTLSLPSVFNSTTLKVVEKHAVEVLGPVEYVWGQPIKVKGELAGPRATPTKCRVLTMLYRRFAPKAIPSKSSGSPSSAHKDEFLHTVQLLPVIVSESDGSRQLIGISCFLANKFHGYLYDVHLQGHLASSFSFMSPTHAVVCDDLFLHALSAESVETYTNRSLQTAILHMPKHNILTDSEWLHKPCPSPSMDLTLVSANQFVSSWCLASSQNHMVIVTKSSEHAQLGKASPSLKKSEMSWNIYILQKKSTGAMYQEFSQLTSLLQDSSPPMYHHLLCEGHTLLRSQILSQAAQPSPSLLDTLRNNCFVMAESLCRYNSAKADVGTAAKYLVLSRHKIGKILQVFTKYPRQPPSPAYSILLKFLETVLFDQKCADDSVEESKVADSILQLYAEFRPLALPEVLLNSWLDKHFTPGKALEVTTSYLRQKSLDSNQIFLGRLCELLFLLALHQQQEAIAKLRQLTDTFFTEWLRKNFNYLLQENSKLSQLGLMLREHRVGCLLEVLYSCLASGTLDLELACKLLKHADSGKHEDLASNLTLKHFLDGIFVEKIPSLNATARLRASILLVDVLVARLTVTTPPPPSSTPFSLYGCRHKWLDSLPPFDGSSSPKPPQVVLQDLMQLQALLCTSYDNNSNRQPGHVTSPSDHMTAVASHFETYLSEEMVGGLSLSLLTWPHTGKLKQAVQCIFQTRPALTVEYCQTYFPPDLSHWKTLLDMLCESCSSATCVPVTTTQPSTSSSSSSSILPHSTSPESLLSTHLNLYKAALSHVASLCHTQELLEVLPGSGTLAFFLPYIEKSCKLELSRELAHHLANSSQDT